jgi:RNA polymerase sigma factor (sigma-70 family)
MANAQLNQVLQQLRTVVTAGGEELSDRQLLDRYAAERDGDAFAALVKRHGTMVRNVCRRVLHNDADAEDAFQAAFLLLARKARSIRNREAVVSWLHGVAYRAATNLRRESARRQARERAAVAAAPARPAEDLSWREVQTILDEEIQRLPGCLQGPVVLCYLEGKTHNEGAEELGLRPTTFRGRLERGRALLRKGLSRRGVELAGALLAIRLTERTAAAALPAKLVAPTVQAALTGDVSPTVLVLADRLVRGAMATRLATTLIALVLVALAALGLGQTIPGSAGPLAAQGTVVSRKPVQVEKPPGAMPVHVHELVKQLGSASYKKRQAAQRELLQLGPDIVPVLDQIKGVDLETHLRLEDIRYRLVGHAEDILRFLKRQSPVYQEADHPVPDDIQGIVADHQPRSGQLLLSLARDLKHKLNWPAVNLFVHTWNSHAPEQAAAYLQNQFRLRSSFRPQYPAGIRAGLEMGYDLQYGWGSWPRPRTLAWQSRTTHYLDGRPYGKPFAYNVPGGATTGWIWTDKLARGKHTFHFVVEYTMEQGGKKLHGQVRSQDYTFEIIAADTANDLIAGQDPATDRLVRHALKILEHEPVEQPPEFDFNGRFNRGPRPDPWAPQITWKDGGLHVPIWKVNEPLPVDLCFAVEFEDLATGKKFQGYPLILVKGKTRSPGYLTLRDVHAFARDRTGFVKVRVRLTPSRALALTLPEITRYFPGEISQELRVRIGPPAVSGSGKLGPGK